MIGALQVKLIVGGLEPPCKLNYSGVAMVLPRAKNPTPTPTPAAGGGSPERFYFNYNFGPAGERGRHDWTRVDSTTWVEQFPSGFQNRIRAIGRITVDGDSGTLLVLVSSGPQSNLKREDLNGKLQYFIPDKGSHLMWLRDRLMGEGWNFLGEMQGIR
jgi:hypothetical protein